MSIMARTATTREWASFLAQLRYEDIPDAAVERTKEHLLDWIGSALAGRDERPVRTLEHFAGEMGPSGRPSEDLISRRCTSPLFAALVNGAASHVVEQDDLHKASVPHPATGVFPAALVAAQQTGASGREFLAALITGYEAGVRVGSYLGRSHYRVFHTTGTAGMLAAATAVSHLLGSDEETMLHALGSVGIQAVGLREFLRDAADSKQLHTTKAASAGLLTAYLARDDFTGAECILEGESGMAAGMSSDADPNKLVQGLRENWALLETSFKYRASCRHTQPAADALLQGMEEQGLGTDKIARVRARVHAAAIDVLGPVSDPRTIHQSTFSVGFVLAMIAKKGSAGIDDFTEEAPGDSEVRRSSEKVEMALDPEVDAAYPRRWIGIVEIETMGDGRFTSCVEVPKGDPGNTLSRQELGEKPRNLAAYGGGASAGEIDRIVARIRNLEKKTDVRDLLPAGSK
jgi:2-methylcitrate dehydratase PrpD